MSVITRPNIRGDFNAWSIYVGRGFFNLQRRTIINDMKHLLATKLVFSAIAAFPLLTYAEESVDLPAGVIRAEGVNGQSDVDSRGPVILVEPKVEDGVVKLLVDGYSPHKELNEYPVRYDIFINRRLVSSQLRSQKNPGAIGLDVPPTLATTPFSYAVVATILHENRTYTTILEGTADGDLAGTYSCVGTLDGVTYTAASETSTTQLGGSSFSFAFAGTNSEESEETASSVTFSGTVTTDSSSTVSASIKTTGPESGETQTFSITGTVTKDESDQITGFDLGSNDGAISISCN